MGGRQGPGAGGGSGGGGMLIDADLPELSSEERRKMEGLAGAGVEEGGISGAENRWKKTTLVSMLDEVGVQVMK